MYTGLSRGGLGEPWGQHLRRRGSDPAWTGSHRHRNPGCAGNDSGLRRWLYYCCGWLCLDYVRPCAHRHRVGRLATVYKRGLNGDTCLTCCTGHKSRARNIVPIQSRPGPRGALHRRPDECHGGSCSLADRLSWDDNTGVHERRLNDTVSRGGRYRTGHNFRHHWSTGDSCDRCRGAAAVTDSTCHSRPYERGSASRSVRVHSLAPIENLRWAWAYFPLVSGERSYTVTNNKWCARVVSRAGDRAGRRCIHNSRTIGTLLWWDPLRSNLFKRSTNNLQCDGTGL